MVAADPTATARDDGQRIIVAEVLGAAAAAGLLDWDPTDEQVDAVLREMRAGHAYAEREAARDAKISETTEPD